VIFTLKNILCASGYDKKKEGKKEAIFITGQCVFHYCTSNIKRSRHLLLRLTESMIGPQSLLLVYGLLAVGPFRQVIGFLWREGDMKVNS
jgi:hypothetical protein